MTNENLEEKTREALEMLREIGTKEAPCTRLDKTAPYIDLGCQKKQDLYRKYLEDIGSPHAVFY